MQASVRISNSGPRTPVASRGWITRRRTRASCWITGRSGSGARHRRAGLQDMAILTGGQVVAEEVGLKLDSVDLSLMGSARKVVITKDDTTIVVGADDAADVESRVSQIKAEIENTDSDWNREKLSV